MRLKQIKLAGFKSFVDPTTVILPGARCAVVGPNGCGKSNIIDAVRWVMGESSAKQLRGESLTDVIFNGSNTRKPTSVANIELLFDNSDGRIGGEYSAYAEIAIRRQVTREGQSQYFLNGSKCRRRDIQDIFLGTGFGPRSYSIIEQGMISQLVEAKPEELRVYLEEAAGISKYKERRRETENRIKHTNENLSRLADIREELGKQLDHLQRQARAAERYRELKITERRLQAELLAIRHRDLAVELDKVNQSVLDREVALERAQSESRRLEADIEQHRSTHADTSETFNGVQGRFYGLGADIARIEEAINYSTERVKQLELDLEAASERGSETGRQLTMDEAQIVEIKAKIEAILPNVESLEADDLAANQLLEGLEDQQRNWQQRWDEFASSAADNDAEAEVQASRIEHLEQLLQRLRGRREELQAGLSHAPGVHSDHVESLAADVVTAEQLVRGADTEIDRCLKDLAASREDVLLRERVLEEARGEVQELRHELASLQAVQQAALGKDTAEAEAWIADQGLQDARRIGEMLAVVPGWETAVEVVLGHFLQGYCVADVDTLARSLAGLGEGDLALIGENEPGPDLVGESRSGLPALSSLVRGNGAALGSVMRGVYAAESDDVALAERHGLEPGQSIITRRGLWVGADWVRIVRSSVAESGIIERGQEIETLNLRVEEAERNLADQQHRVVEARAQVEQLENDREALQGKVNELNTSLAALRTDHGVRRVQLEEEGARRERLAKDRADIDEQIDSEQSRLNDARERLVVAESKREYQMEDRARFGEEREAITGNLESARESARSSRERYHALNAERQGLASRLAASETARERLLKQQSDLEGQVQSLQNGIESNSTPLPKLKEDLEEKLTARVTVEEELTGLRRSLEELDLRIREADSKRGESEENVNTVRGKLEEARLSRQSFTVQEANIREQMEPTGHELEAVTAELPEDSAESSWREELERVDRRIQRLGAINLAAIDEFEAQSERKEYLDTQAQDLEEALATLTNAIQKIDRETRSRFKETFEKVNTRLGELFPKVFGGGHAYLELTGEDLLDTGVSLMARPPGKRNASVHLLSGGEKAMTAVALIFAIFHLNPSPVCLLDEVDAPLDDSNVTRFAELISEMSAEVQFVVITHNKITMEMADHLMGVTMSEPGVSRLVSVDVEEAAALAVAAS